MLLKIENNGVAPVQGFTVLGVSTSRGNSEKIGQFGSGNKHGINILMRNMLTPVVFLGNERLEFSTVKDKMGEKEFEQVIYHFRGETHKTGFALEFGEMDWNDIGMGIREFISNAIDCSGTDIKVELVSEMIPDPNKTQVYIPVNDQVKAYVNNLENYFLHFQGKEKETVLRRPNIQKGKVYRKGVFVREIEKNSLFDYNFGDESKIDESRNMDDHSCSICAVKLLGKNVNLLKILIRDFVEDSQNKKWEDNFSYYYIDTKVFQQAWEELYGKNTVICKDEAFADMARKEGYNVKVIKRGYQFFEYSEIPDVFSVIGKAYSEGIVPMPATPIMRDVFNKVWNKLSSQGFCANKRKPELSGFQKNMGIMDNFLAGYYDPVQHKVFIHMEHEANVVTHLEEICHAITGLKDNERGFQDFAFGVAARFMF